MLLIATHSFNIIVHYIYLILMHIHEHSSSESISERHKLLSSSDWVCS